MPEEYETEEITRSFLDWFNENIARKGYPLTVVLDLLTVLYLRLRLWMTAEQAHGLMHQVAANTDQALEAEEIILELRDGTQVPYRTAEYFNENPEARQLLIEASHSVEEDQEWDISELVE